MGGFYGRIQYVSTSCLRYGAPIQQLTSGCSVALFRIKRFRRTKHFATFVLFRTKRFLGTKLFTEFIWFHLKRFCETKLPEDCRLWPAAHEVERIAPTWRTGPHGPAGSRTWDPSFPNICLISMFSRGTAKLMKQHKIRKEARSSAKPCLFSCHYKACRYLQRRFLVLPSGFEPKPSEPESEILSIRLWEQKGTGTNAAMRN